MHVTSLCTKTQMKLFKQTLFESIHSKDYSWQGPLNLSDVLSVKLRNGLNA